jgi:lincosamide nucleotidyltransferase A/C/D/E
VRSIVEHWPVQDRSPRAPMAAADVVALLDALEPVTAWLDGGWGVDALLGEQTREHDDLDLVVAEEDVVAAGRALTTAGYAYAEGAPVKPVYRDAAGRQVDLHPVAFDEQGDGVQTLPDGRTWPYPAAGFAGRGTVAGREVHCLTPEVQVLTHAGYELDADDIRDLRALRERFGVELPPEAA